MKEKDFSTEEKELFELLDWAIDYLEHGRFKNKEDKENAPISIQMFHDPHALITKCADKRHADLIQIEEENNDHLHEYHDVTCPKCKFLAALIPTGKKKNAEGYTCPTFECPKCYHEFVFNQPLETHEMVAFCEAMLKKLYKSKAPMLQVLAFKEHIANLKNIQKTIDEDHAEMYRQHAEIAELVTKNIAELLVYKQQELANENPGFLN